MRPAFRALVFDFDGLILETERPEYQAWLEIYGEHGQDLSLEVWGDVIGRGPGYFDPITDLEARLGRPIDREVVKARQKARHQEMIDALEILPGVADYVLEAGRLGLKLAVASSSSRRWVTGHLAALGLDEFACVICRDDVARAKPYPDLYLEATRCLGVAPAEAVAFEDSANGVAAAKAAGLTCVAVPNQLTAGLDLSAADLRIASLAEMPLPRLLDQLLALPA
ncbi:MAG: HAD-IA family hydrolase [Candidatus Dormibacteraeota bacterium]|nr:HAD-IA family hydrolase [Candidatus Dormibacteraeota bacterium]